MLKREFPREKFEELMKLAYTDDMSSTSLSRDVDGNVMHEEGLNEMITCFFGDGKNDESGDPMHNNDDVDIEGNYH